VSNSGERLQSSHVEWLGMTIHNITASNLGLVIDYSANASGNVIFECIATITTYEIFFLFIPF
jgi:hypothetical protein